MSTGSIRVQTENIFPIIKKFLYSDQEIFLRELISNATDATLKLKTLLSVGEFKGELGETTIDITLDTKKKTLTISDKGIGMSAEDVEKYINQVAFSGAEEFVKKYEGKTNIIGHFGLGFYSAFMVADKVEIITKSYTDVPAVKWVCEGNTEYKLEEYKKKKERGTDIVLHLSDESSEFLEETRIQNLLDKYCKFMPIPIRFGKKKEWVKDEENKEKDKEIEVDNIINNPEPAWTKSPQDLKEEDYQKFYKELYPYQFEETLFHIHLNVDYPFNLTGILYFPKIKNKLELRKEKIQLYCNQVFVTDNVEGVVPEYLTLIHGVLDSPDIPLNVSRSYLQSDANVKKISSHISKKVADKLEEMYKTDAEDFKKKWDDIRVFIEYGMLTDEKFFERALKFMLLKDTTGNCLSFAEYKEKVKPLQTDKDKKIIFLYANHTEDQHSYIQIANEKGYNVLVMDTPLTAHLLERLERHDSEIHFTRVDADIIDKLIKKEEQIPCKLSEEEKEKIKPLFEAVLSKEKYSISIDSLSETDAPITITQPEFMRRMKEMSALGGGVGFYGALPEMFNVVVNANHPLASKILNEGNEEKKKKIAKQAADLALLSQGMLKGEELTRFVKRSFDLIK
ncbi:MAG: molecular chaperone HtpG [Flavobacteriales bacterium]|nr:molecular chaperone HtpG [Flavobacteriales bacterium]